MKYQTVLARVLAIFGTVLVWVPVLAPLAFTRWSNIGTGHFNFDWLIPAELAPVMLIGGGILMVAALLTQCRRALIAWGLVIAFGSIALGAILVSATGLASGETEPAGILWAALIGPIVLLVGANVELGVAGILLAKDLFAQHEPAGPPAATAS